MNATSTPRAFGRAATAGYDRVMTIARMAYVRLGFAVLTLFGIVFLGWALNVVGVEGANYVFFFGLGAVIIWYGFQPANWRDALIIGGIIAALEDEDVSQGTLEGIKLLYKVVLGILFGVWIITGFLATWSMSHNPYAVLPIMAGLFMTGVTVLLFDMMKGNKIAGKLAITYAVIIILLALWSTFSPETRNMVEGKIPGNLAQSSAGEKLALQYELHVPVGDCSDVVDNTDYRYTRTDVKPKNPKDAYPPAKIVKAGGLGWVDYTEGARYAKIAYCGSPKAMTMIVSKYK